MALTASTIWQVEPGSGSDTNAALFDPSQTAGMLTDGAATSATSTAPVFTSASYNFVSGDVGAFVYVASGTNWIAGWYKIASVASNAATLTATIAGYTLSNCQLSTVAGCATTSSPTGATWTIDYSQQAAAQISYTDIVIGATTTQGTSIAHPFGKQMVGNGINIASGAGFTVQRVCIQSVSTVTATFDKSLGTTASTGGTGKLGGAAATLATPVGVGIAGNLYYLTGTLTVTAALTLSFNVTAGRPTSFVGYTTVRGDSRTPGASGQPVWTTATNSVDLVSFTGSGVSGGYLFRNIKFTNTAGTPLAALHAVTTTNTYNVAVVGCYLSGFGVGINGNFVQWSFNALLIDSCEITGCSSYGIDNWGSTYIIASYIHSNGASGMHQDNYANTGPWLMAINSVFKSNGGNAGIEVVVATANVPTCVINCALINNTGDGLRIGGAAAGTLLMWNNINDSNGGYGVNFSSGGEILYWGPSFRNNAYGSGGTANTSGDMGGSPPPIKDPSDVVLTGDPFTSRSTGDFTLNNTAGAGAACRGAGYPTVIPG